MNDVLSGMKAHDWSDGVPVYEGLCRFKCRNCGAEIGALNFVGPEALVEANLPEDCDEAKLSVIHESYEDASGAEPWMDGDVHVWGPPPEEK